MYTLATMIRDSETGPVIHFLVLNSHGFPVIEATEEEWKDLVTDSWKMLSQANSKLYELATKGKYKADPFTIVIDRSVL